MNKIVPAFVRTQEQKERTLDEIKVEAIHRAEVGGYPLIGVDSNDVRAAFEHIHTRDQDEVGSGFYGNSRPLPGRRKCS